MNLKEIAKEIGVSTATVSLVLNGKNGVGEEKRKAITQMLYDNGYKLLTHRDPNAASKEIQLIKYCKHSLLVNGNPGFVTSIIDAVDEECRGLGYSLTITTCSASSVHEVFDLVVKRSPQGIILLATEMESEDLAHITSRNVPMVAVDNIMDHLNYDSVTMNNHEAIYNVISYLMQLGYREIGFLSNALASSNCRARLRAYKHALSDSELPFKPEYVYTLQPTPDGAYESMRELLQAKVKFPQALIANNDSIALGALKAFNEVGVRIPEDISLIGFDGIPFSSISHPPLTTVLVPCREIGAWAVKLLCHRIDHPEAAVTKIQVGTRLLMRQSTRSYNADNRCPYVLSRSHK